MDIPFEVRLSHIVAGYGKYSIEKLKDAALRIQKRLGGLETKTAIAALEENRIEEAFSIFLKYYDKLYLKSTLNTNEGEREIIYIKSDVTDAKLNTKLILDHAREYNNGRAH
jgi:tRNA 2-selenouridine synthase